MKKPFISIIIPCYNGASFIATTIQSVIAQTYPNFECILIDDGSTDNSATVIQEIVSSDNRMRYYYQQNKGLSGARNAGMRLSKGEYIYFLDADDLLPKNAISDLVDLAGEGIDIVFGKTATTDGQNRVIVSYLEHNPEVNQIFKNENYSLFTLITENTITGVAHNRLFAKQFLTQNMLQFKEGILHEDELWFFEILFHASQIILCDTVTYYYNVNNEGSIMSRYTLEHLDHYLSIIRIFYREYYTKLDNDQACIAVASYMTRIKMVIVTYWLYEFKGGDKELAYQSVLHTFQETRTDHDFNNLSKIKGRLFTIFNKMIVKNLNDAQFYFKYYRSKRIKKKIKAYLLAKKY